MPIAPNFTACGIAQEREEREKALVLAENEKPTTPQRKRTWFPGIRFLALELVAWDLTSPTDRSQQVTKLKAPRGRRGSENGEIFGQLVNEHRLAATSSNRLNHIG